MLQHPGVNALESVPVQIQSLVVTKQGSAYQRRAMCVYAWYRVYLQAHQTGQGASVGLIRQRLETIVREVKVCQGSEPGDGSGAESESIEG